jgi:hypothetical protein
MRARARSERVRVGKEYEITHKGFRNWGDDACIKSKEKHETSYLRKKQNINLQVINMKSIK